MSTYQIQGKRIETFRQFGDWIATLDSYDGAPDAAPENRALGWNRTSELGAVNDLLAYLDMDGIATLEVAA